jgi:2,3-dihydro-2,3-dihydroxybenzoate dehydrogenase
MSINGMAFVITGGASGIGLATAEAVVRRGGAVALVDMNGQGAQDEADRLDPSGRATGIQADVSDPTSIGSALESAFARFSRLDGVVACAGIRQNSARIADLSLEAWERIIRVDLRGTFLTCQAAARIFKRTGGEGAIVNVSSLSGHSPRVGQAAYCAAKAGVISLTKVLALELASQRVRVNCVCPGTAITPFNKDALEREGEQGVQARILGDPSQFRPGIPLRRLAEASDIAESIVFLLGPESRHITGVELFIDGGESVF